MPSGVGTALATMSKRPRAISALSRTVRQIITGRVRDSEEVKIVKAKEPDDRCLTPYLCYCKKCGKILPIQFDGNANTLYKKVFCPSCARELYEKKSNLKDQLEKLDAINKDKTVLIEASKEHEINIEEAEKRFQEYMKQQQDVQRGLSAIEEEIGTGVILSKEEVLGAVLESFVLQRNIERNVAQETKEYYDDEKTPSPKGRRSYQSDILGDLCQRIHDDRLRKEQETAEAIERKGF